jgi:hypothetical protein
MGRVVNVAELLPDSSRPESRGPDNGNHCILTGSGPTVGEVCRAFPEVPRLTVESWMSITVDENKTCRRFAPAHSQFYIS